MRGKKSKHTNGDRREVVVEILAQAILELALRGEAAPGTDRAARLEAETPKTMEAAHDG